MVNEVVGSCDWEQGESLGKTWKGRCVFSYGRNEGEGGITAGTVLSASSIYTLNQMSDSSLYNLPYATSTGTVGFMYLFLPALTPILVLITCTQRNTTP